MNNVFRRSQILHGVFTFIYLKNWLCAIENFPEWPACILAGQFVRTVSKQQRFISFQEYIACHNSVFN